MDLEHIFQAYSFIPGIDSTSNDSAWIEPGMMRIVYFDDGSQSHEYLLSVSPGESFTYKVNSFTGPLSYLIEQINGSWSFAEDSSGNLQIEWVYEFIPKNRWVKPLIRWFIIPRIQVPMNRALEIMKLELESGKLYPYKRRFGNW